MKLLIDNLNSATGWVANSPSEVTENDHTQYIAGFNTKSILLKFDALDLTRVISKSITPVDVSSYDTLILNVWGQKFKRGKYEKPTDFSYKISFDGITEFYLEIPIGFADVAIPLDGVSEINRIEITALHSATDYISLSYMVVETQELTEDVMESTKEAIKFFLNGNWGNGILVDTVSTTAGDIKLDISTGVEWLDKYAVIIIDDGVNSETHKLWENGFNETGTRSFKLDSAFDGKTIINDFTDANLYLAFPVEINPSERDINAPGIAIWGIEAEPISREAKVNQRDEGFRVGGGQFERLFGQRYIYTVTIDIEAHQSELNEKMARSVRKFIAYESLWINGRRHDIEFTGPPTETTPINGIDILPKVQYTFNVEIVEETAPRVELPITTVINTSYEVGRN